MDPYSSERWTLERHHEMERAAEDHMRLLGWRPQDRLAELLALQLRRLADRLDGSVGIQSHGELLNDL